jgi:hypothetical protein
MTEIENPVSSLSKAVKTETDNIVALICKSIAGRANVCHSELIKKLTENI